MVGEVDGLPADIAGRGAGCRCVEGQLIVAQATIDGGCGGQQAFIQAAQQGGVVTIAHQHRGLDLPTVKPPESVVADAGTDLTTDHAATHGNAVVTTAGADIAADAASGNDDGVSIKTGDQVAQDGASGHVIEVLVQLHIHSANGATALVGHIAVLKGIDDGASLHPEGVEPIALEQRLYLPTEHDEVIDASPLLHRAGDLPGLYAHRIHARAKGDITVDGAGAACGEGQMVIPGKVGKAGTAAAVARIGIVTGSRGENAGGMRGLRDHVLQ